MERYHLNTKTFNVVSCSDSHCPLYPESAHYYSRKDAEGALELLRSFSSLYTGNSKTIDFCALKSSKSEQIYLEAMVTTPFGEEVYFTIENFGNHAVGSLFIAGKEYILARRDGYVDLQLLEETAKASLAEAKVHHRADIWPDEAVIKLYESLERYSTASDLIAPTIQLSESLTGGQPQLFLGETLNGTEVSLQVAYGYAVAEIITEDGRQIVHEGNTSHQLFVNERERNIFAAKSFGDLLASGSI